ncbi:MAG: hypothetical protein HY299_15855 [Verrucomicrobia bacterium]|nr:hypothetical protein [Verrucomicrobiota bacterium]
MNVTVGKLRPLSRMVNPVCWVFMPISKWSQQMRWHLTDDYRKAKPPRLPFTMFGWVKQRFEMMSGFWRIASEPVAERFRHNVLLAGWFLAAHLPLGGDADETSGQVCRETERHRNGWSDVLTGVSHCLIGWALYRR